MSNRNPLASYSEPAQALPFAMEQRLLDVHTSLPGIVDHYDPATRRAKVVPALDLLLRDEQGTVTRRQRAMLTDVPVLHPAGGGYVVHVPLRRGDAVLLLFSERGIDRFKATFQRDAPDMGPIHAEKDAVAVPGFGALELTPAGTTGLTVQSEDGEEYVRLQDGTITVRSAGTITLDGDVRVTGTLQAEGQVTAEDGVDVSGGDLRQGR